MSIRSKAEIALLALALLTVVARASNLSLSINPQIGGGIGGFDGGIGSPPSAVASSCSNKLDFSVACNSQYFNAIF